MQVKTLRFVILWLASTIPSFARDKLVSQVGKTSTLQFVKNEGQLKDQTGKPRPELHTRLKTGNNLNVFTGAGLLIYQWQKKGEMYRVEANLIGANTNIQPLYELPLSYTEQYFGKGKDIKAQSYSRIVYPGVYPNIDWVLYFNDDAHLKYDFIVHPGGKVSDIQLQYCGASTLHLQENGSLRAITPMGSIGEHAPVSYTQEGRAVGSRFIVNDNIVSFEVAPYTGTLIIDPEIAWGTYFGGLLIDYTDAVSTDKFGNVYTSGYTRSLDNIATTGSYQTSFGGSDIVNNGGDAFIAKYNCAGEKVWATYYGGAAAERGWNVVADDYGHIYMAGFTNLLSGLPSSDNLATAGSHQTTPGGSDGDLFLVKLDSAGNRIWATYYGGAGKENSPTLHVGLALDKMGHVYLSGTTNSTSAIATTGSYQPALAGSNDAFLVQFDTAGVRQWATYYGGTGNDRGGPIHCDALGNVYLSGITASNNGIASPGSHQPIFGGGNDAFLVKFNVNGTRQWSTYYGGTGNADEGMGLYTDSNNQVYLAGRTNSTTGISTTGAHQTVYGGGLYDAFIAKFDGTGTRLWGSYFGGMNQGNLIGYRALTGDGNGAVYLCGYAKETDSLSTPGSMQANHSGSDDAFLAQFTEAGSLDWCTYYGGSGADLATSIALNEQGYLYLAGNTTSTSGIATLGSAQANFGGGNNDAYLVNLAVAVHFAAPDTILGPVMVCAGSTHTYSINPVPNAISYQWTLPASWTGSSTTHQLTVTVGTATDTLRVKAIYACGESEDINLVVGIVPDAVILVPNGASLCAQDTVVLSSNMPSGTVYTWLKDGIIIPNQSGDTLAVQEAGTYTLVTELVGCTDTSSAITVHPLPAPVISQIGQTLSTGLYAAYQWYYQDNAITGAVAQSYTYVQDGTYKVKVTDTNGCSAFSPTVLIEPTRVTDLDLASNVLIYPNPTADVVQVQAPFPVRLTLYSLEGTRLSEPAEGRAIDLRRFTPGLYLLRVETAHGQFILVEKLIKTDQ